MRPRSPRVPSARRRDLRVSAAGPSGVPLPSIRVRFAQAGWMTLSQARRKGSATAYRARRRRSPKTGSCFSTSRSWRSQRELRGGFLQFRSECKAPARRSPGHVVAAQLAAQQAGGGESRTKEQPLAPCCAQGAHSGMELRCRRQYFGTPPNSVHNVRQRAASAAPCSRHTSSTVSGIQGDLECRPAEQGRPPIVEQRLDGAESRINPPPCRDPGACPLQPEGARESRGEDRRGRSGIRPVSPPRRRRTGTPPPWPLPEDPGTRSTRQMAFEPPFPTAFRNTVARSAGVLSGNCTRRQGTSSGSSSSSLSACGRGRSPTLRRPRMVPKNHLRRRNRSSRLPSSSGRP